MSDQENLEQRVAALETDVAELRRQVAELHRSVSATDDRLADMVPPAGPMGTSPPFEPPGRDPTND
jgi:uncharacterized coiled-coil protein SlyX